MNKPLISVIFSVYNGAPYLKEAIESILNQTCTDFEFIIVDDGSTDETPKILDSFTDCRIVRLNNKKNIGLVQSLNKALSIAQGEFIARMDADDISLPERFEKQLDYLKKHPQVGVLGSAISQVDKRGRPISVLTPPINNKIILWEMFFSCPIFHATVMMRRSIVMMVGYYDVNFIHAEDIELWSRLFFKTKFANLSEVLYIRRLHNRSIISTQFTVQYQKGIIIRQRLLKSFLGHTVSDDIVSWFLRSNQFLNQYQRETILSLLLELYDKIVQIDSIISTQEKEFLQADLAYKIAMANQGYPRFLLRRLILYFGKIFPVPLRHKIKVFLNKYSKDFFFKNNN